MKGCLKAGAAKVDITPAVGMELCGHFRNDLKSTGVHSSLYAKAVVLSDGEAVLVACDLLGLTSDFVASARERISELTGINGVNVMISCTHTHSGPGSMPLRVVGKSDDAYQDQLVKKIAGAVYMASRDMKEAGIGLGIGTEDLAASRRVKWPDGSIRFEWLSPDIPPEEPVDKELKVLTVKDMERNAVAVAINFACHPVTMGGKAFNLISSDFPGVATGLIEKVKGGKTVAMFLNGAYADTHPRKDLVPGYNNRSRVEVDELTMTFGTVLGAAALRISETTHIYSDISVQTRSEIVRVPLEKPPSEEELVNAEVPKREGWWLKPGVDWKEYLLERYRGGKRFETYEDLEVQVIKIADTFIVGVPGEVFSRVGLEIKKRACKSGHGKVLVVALANGNPGYVPAEEDYAVAPIGKRGYELEGSYMLYGRPLVGQGTSTLLIETAVKLIDKL